MKYSYVFEDKNNDGLQELRKLGEKWYELYLRNQTTISDMEKLKNQKTMLKKYLLRISSIFY